MTIRKATIPSKTRIGAHTPLFLRITTPAERRHIQTHPGETFLVPNEDSETGGWPQRAVETIRAYANMLNKNGTFWVVDSRSDGQGGFLVWLSWDQHEAKRRRAVRRRKGQD
jgi:hypothetical protein|nr:MAG TPA: hypothetical protein [Caudoviricetes sp.]